MTATRAAIICLLAPLSACTGLNQPSQQVMSASKRDLYPEEKHALSVALSQTLKDPDSAKFKWMPVVLTQRDGVTDYCGLMNGKNSYGGYTGFTRFYAQLTANSKGFYMKGEMRALEEPNREINPLDPRWLNGICEQFGYSDFSLAQ